MVKHQATVVSGGKMAFLKFASIGAEEQRLGIRRPEAK